MRSHPGNARSANEFTSIIIQYIHTVWKPLKGLSLYDIIIMTANYGFTIKCIKRDADTTEGELAGTMYSMALYHKAQVKEYYFENDSLGRKHIHGIMCARKGLLLNRYKKPYWTIHLDNLKTDEDLSNWRQYIKKEEDGYHDFLTKLRLGDNLFI